VTILTEIIIIPAGIEVILAGIVVIQA